MIEFLKIHSVLILTLASGVLGIWSIYFSRRSARSGFSPDGEEPFVEEQKPLWWGVGILKMQERAGIMNLMSIRFAFGAVILSMLAALASEYPFK